MPKQGQSVETCIISSINKQKGETVKKGDVLFSYETDKASFEEESPIDGVILESFYNEGDEVPVLDNMMIVGDSGEDYSSLMAEIKQSEKEIEDTKSETEDNIQLEEVKQVSVGHTEAKQSSEMFISPRAKSLAKKEALDYEQIVGTGPSGRIIEKDIKAALLDRPKLTSLAKKVAAEQGLYPAQSGSGLAGKARLSDLSAAPANAVYGEDYEDIKLTNIRKLIAKSMHASLQNSAQLTHHLSADARQLLQLRKQAKASFESGNTSANITINDMVCYAVVKALKKFPNVNTHFLGDSIRQFKKVHLALAVDTERGLMVPAVRNADDLSISGLSNQLKEVANSCRSGSVNPDLLASESATFTVSNLGNYGVEMFTPIINLPQSAILGVNTIVPRPKDLGDGVYGFVPHIGLSLTYDHRSLDGGEATRFLKQIAIEIENLKIDF